MLMFGCSCPMPAYSTKYGKNRNNKGQNGLNSGESFISGLVDIIRKDLPELWTRRRFFSSNSGKHERTLWVEDLSREKVKLSTVIFSQVSHKDEDDNWGWLHKCCADNKSYGSFIILVYLRLVPNSFRHWQVSYSIFTASSILNSEWAMNRRSHSLSVLTRSKSSLSKSGHTRTRKRWNHSARNLLTRMQCKLNTNKIGQDMKICWYWGRIR